MTETEERFDDTVGHVLSLDEEEAKYLREAVLELNYETLYKQLWKRQEEFARITTRNYFIVIALQVILLALYVIEAL